MVSIEPIATPAIDTVRETLPGIQQNVESVFVNFKVDPWVGVHGGRDVYEHDKEDKEQREPPGQKPLWHYLNLRHPDGKPVFPVVVQPQDKTLASNGLEPPLTPSKPEPVLNRIA